MGMVMPPTEKMAKSACTHSARLPERMPTASPFFRPSAMRPPASSRTLSPTSFQVSVRQAPSRLSCWAAPPPLPSTRLQNSLASVSFAIATSSHLCAELFAQDLPDGALGEGLHEAHLLRALVAGQPRLAEGHDLVPARRLAGAEPHEGEDVLAHEGIRHPDDRGLRRLRKRVEDLLDLAGVDVEAPADDEVLLALDDVEEALPVQSPHVAGVEPAAPHRARGLDGIAVVAEHHVGALHAHLAHLAGRQRPIGVVLDGDGHT